MSSYVLDVCVGRAGNCKAICLLCLPWVHEDHVASHGQVEGHATRLRRKEVGFRVMGIDRVGQQKDQLSMELMLRDNSNTITPL